MVFIFPGVKGFGMIIIGVILLAQWFQVSIYVHPCHKFLIGCNRKQFQYLNLVLTKRHNYFWNSIDENTRFSFLVR